MKFDKTIIFLNLRFADFYSKNLFAEVKNLARIRLVAIVDQQFKNKIPTSLSQYLDEIYSLSSPDKDGFLAEFDYASLCEIIKKEKVLAKKINLVCADEFNLLNAGKLRKQFDLAGHTDEILILYRDKLKMKEKLQSVGIRVPYYRALTKEESYDDLKNSLGSPFVIKPIDSCGSHGVHIIENELQFNNIKNYLRSSTAIFEAEEFIQGNLYHVDSCITNYSLQFICASEYTCPNHDYTKGKVLGSIPLDAENPLSKRLITFATTCLQTLHTNNMINHMELFVNHLGEIIFLEISGRPPGALVNLMHEINFGINLMNIDFLLQSDLNLEMPKNEKCTSAFYALFPLLPGRINKLNTPRVQSKMEFFWHVTIGDQFDHSDCANIVNKAAHAIFYNENKMDLYNDFETIKHHQAIEVI